MRPSLCRTYYPVVLSDWWMDDWISKALAPPRAIRRPLSYPSCQDVAAPQHSCWDTSAPYGTPQLPINDVEAAQLCTEPAQRARALR
jgi:hypothetical protein